ncbi:hypothetical protein A2781_01230 [Candidatus Gottesmanbacteria bacterium RIFCSPHIGHO2_01_FULL_42_27]|uniref:Uncharacterized protein n=1 Tax=Candidatus Gottesmanbacteria bacterium RIFCSPLOWO2_01_FULL_42_22 TaxID=1798391 RepID=A0A1F6BJG3_9BACT|nr:MAG: hypothetical protein UV46_C0002G0017 [Candidatus Gottesmanbacteria bacterium GW2011_GWC2_42_8]OGG10956.1 MAG: hypothetical protein A2781_01230 [Candidatus Gottesmanbacteria bacterium RIFCSPHIGHO2_01_FULL_42_27]OGG37076.1 MAG: hypothetical protein A2968_01360 [Candidatus Gottesmanbacteria bacterium RIFCSPLOWO2_01_FULL_42_22]
MTIALPAVEAIPRQIMAGEKLKPLEIGKLNSATLRANQLLDKGKSVRESTPGEIATQLTSIEDEKIRASLADTVSRADEEIEEARKRLSSFFETPAKERTAEQIVKLQQESFAEVIDNLERLKATPAETDDQQQIHDDATATLENLAECTEVTITGRDEPVTLAQWNEEITSRARSIWKADTKNPAANDSGFDALDPLTQYAFRLKAKTAILKTEKPDKRLNDRVTIRFIGRDDTVKGQQEQKQPQEPEDMENLGPEEIVYNETKNTIHDILALADGIDVNDPEALKKVFSPNQMIAWLEYLYEGYTSLNNGDIKLAPKALARNKQMVAGLLYSHFQEMSGEEYIKGLPENMQNILKPVLEKINKEFSDPNVLKTLDVGLFKFDNEIIRPLLQQVSKEPEQLYQDIINGQLSRVGILVLGARFQHIARKKGSIFFDFDGTYDQLVKETGMQLSPGEKTFIKSLCTDETLFDGVNERMETMGIDLMEIGDPAAWLEHHNERVVRSTLTETEKNLPESELNNLLFKRLEANKIIHEFDGIEVVRNMHLADKLKLMMLMAAMFSSQIQQGLESGTVLEDHRQG